MYSICILVHQCYYTVDAVIKQKWNMYVCTYSVYVRSYVLYMLKAANQSASEIQWKPVEINFKALT